MSEATLRQFLERLNGDASFRERAQTDPESAFAEFGPLGSHIRYVERGSRKLARSTFYLMGRYQAKLEHKGHLLGRIVDTGAELYAIACACVYAQTLAREDATRRDGAFELADLFARQARRRADALFHELWANDDASQYKAAQQVLEGRYAWFDEDVMDPSGEGAMIPEHPTPAKDRLPRAGEPVQAQAEAVQ